MCRVTIEYPQEVCEHIKVTGRQCDLLRGEVRDDESYKFEVVLWMKDQEDPDDQEYDFMRFPFFKGLKNCPLWKKVPSEKILKTTCKVDGGDGPDVGPCSENWKFKVYFVDKKGRWEAKTLGKLDLEREWKYTLNNS
jgi:hypothetical protein